MSPRPNAAYASWTTCVFCASDIVLPPPASTRAARIRIGYDRVMRLETVVEVSRAVAGTAGRLEKIGHLADLLARVPPDELTIVIACLSGEPRQGRMKIGGAALAGLRGLPPASTATLDLREVDAVFDRIASIG